MLCQSGNTIIPVSTGAGGCSERLVAPGCSSIPGFLTHRDGTSWTGLGKARQSQSPDGIFVLPGNRRGEGSECGWGHGRSVGCAANPALCQRLWDRKSSDFAFPLSVPPSQAQGSLRTAALPPRALGSAGQTPACPGSFFQLFLFKETEEKKAISFLLSRLVNFRPSLEQPLSARTGSARPRDRRQDPPPPSRTLGLGLPRDFSLSPRQDFPLSSVSVTKPS